MFAGRPEIGRDEVHRFHMGLVDKFWCLVITPPLFTSFFDLTDTLFRLKPSTDFRFLGVRAFGRQAGMDSLEDTSSSRKR